MFCIPSDRTPVRRARQNDRAFLYLAGQGFVAEAEISSPARCAAVKTAVNALGNATNCYPSSAPRMRSREPL